MKTDKQEVRALLQRLPENSSFEDIQYHLYVLQKIKRGQADVISDCVATHAQAKQRLSKWLRPFAQFVSARAIRSRETKDYE